MTLDVYSATMVAVLVVGWTFYGVIWRLYWSPLAKFPGPKSVALTYWVEFYYDVIKGGMYIWEIKKMHREYGRKTCTLPNVLGPAKAS